MLKGVWLKVTRYSAIILSMPPNKQLEEVDWAKLKMDGPKVWVMRCHACRWVGQILSPTDEGTRCPDCRRDKVMSCAPVLIGKLAHEIGLPTEVVEEMYNARRDVASLVPRVKLTALEEESEEALSEHLASLRAQS